MGVHHDNRKLYYAISTIIVLFAAMGLSSIYAVFDLNRDVENLYRHPFAVSNATKNIRLHIAAMHTGMKDVILTRSSERVAALARDIASRELEVMREFDTVFERFLGDSEQINRFHAEFIEWRTVRDEVIFLARAGEHEQARELTEGIQEQKVERLEQIATDVVEFAVAKASEFHALAERRRLNYFALLGTVLGLALLFSIWIAVMAVRQLRGSQRTLLRQARLIDDHIGMATMSTDGRILKISQQLTRLLGLPARKLIDSDADAILPVGDDAPSVQTILDYGGSGRSWTGRAHAADPDMAHRHFAVEAHPVRDDDFRVIEYMLLYEDITEKVRVEELSRVDKLTDLPNRRAYDERLERMVRRARREKKFLTLAIVDIDNFKAYNDLYGHPQGDFALERVASVLMDIMRRPDDHAFRLGGEEFALVFVGLDAEQSVTFLESVRQAVEHLALPHAANTGVAQVLTVSLGAAIATPDHAMAPQVLYQHADKQLYQAKQTRNAVALTDAVELVVLDGKASRRGDIQPTG